MAEETAVAVKPRLSLIEVMAHEYGMEAKPFLEAIQQTVMPGSATNAQIAAFLQVAHEYKLNPFIKEIYAFPTKGGGIQPVVAVDGWIYKITSHPEFKGMEKPLFEYDEKGKIVSCTITALRKDWDTPIVVQEWFDECYRNTDPWNKMPRRMMRNRTICQLGRIGFGIHGIMLPEEAEEINITAESTVMERSTNERTEQLKEKIGAKKEEKAKKAETKAPEPPPPPVEAVPEPTPEAIPEPPPVDEPPFDLEPPAAAQEENGNKIISDKERNEFLTILKAKTSPANSDAIMKATRKRLFDLGYTNTKEVKLKDLKGLMEWAKALNV